MITVDRAIKRGQRIMNIPVFILIMGTMCGGFYLIGIKILPTWMIPVLIFGSSIPAWIYWSFAITKWRIWAFSNVDNVHELKQQAIESSLIWPDGSFFEKTEIRTKKERQLIDELEKRFREPRRKKQFVDDQTILPLTKIYYSKLSLSIEIILMAGSLSVGIYLWVSTDSQIIGTILILTGGYFAIKDFKKLTTFEPQIIIDNRGIEINGEKYSWTEIRESTTTFENFGKKSASYIYLETVRGTIKQNIDNYDTSFRELRHVLNIYKGRFEKATTANKMFLQ